jgi:hypothetical protein
MFHASERGPVLSDLIHRGCGGTVIEDWSSPYCFEGDDAKAFGEKVPRYICRKCGKEMLGDSEVQIIEGINSSTYRD